MFNTFYKFFAVVFVVLFIIVEVSGQTTTRRNSPYSRYGMGDLFSLQFAPNSSMSGGLAASYSSYFDVNLTNPASLAKLRFTAFEAGVFYQHDFLSEPTTGLSARANDGNLNYLSLAFPITRSWEIEKDSLRRGIPIQWGMAFSLLPHSTVGYDVLVVRTLEDVGDVQYRYDGSGTRYRINWGNAWRYKGFSLGANMGAVLGKTTSNSTLSFLDTTNYFYSFNQNIATQEQNVAGFVWDVGLHYEYVFKAKGKLEKDPQKDLTLKIGAYGNGGASLRTYNSERFLRDGSFYNPDTLANTEGTIGSISIPPTLGAGISIGKPFKWQLGMSFEQTWWSQFQSSTDASITLADAYKLAIGAEITPNQEDYKNYAKRMSYRFGAFIGNDYRVIGTQQLRKMGASFGLGFPIKTKTSLSFINLGLEYGYLGAENLIQDHYLKVTLGVTLNDDRWFVRPKFR